MDTTQLTAVLTPRTRCLLPVHLYGQCGDPAPHSDLAARHDLLILEDCAQAHGARHDGGLTGTFGDAAAPGHNSRLDELQAEILHRKLRRLGDYIAGHRAVAARYAEALAGTDLALPASPPATTTSITCTSCGIPAVTTPSRR